MPGKNMSTWPANKVFCDCVTKNKGAMDPLEQIHHILLPNPITDHLIAKIKPGLFAHSIFPTHKIWILKTCHPQFKSSFFTKWNFFWVDLKILEVATDEKL